MSGHVAIRVVLSLIFMAAILWAIWMPVRAAAHSPEHFLLMESKDEMWLRGLKNQKGELCCNGKDGYDAVYDIEGNHYRVLLYGTYWIVPPDAVITQPNRIGVAQVWYTTLWENGAPKPTIRCFIPGAGI